MSGYDSYPAQYPYQHHQQHPLQQQGYPPQQAYPHAQPWQRPPPPPPVLPLGGDIHLGPQASTSQLPKQLVGNTELVKVTAKVSSPVSLFLSRSCSNCRSRKVKCDRRYPDCSRCIKRKETCDYGEDVSISQRAPPLQQLQQEPVYDNSRSLRTISDMQHHHAISLARQNEDGEEEGGGQKNLAGLWASFLSASNLGASSSDWRLAVPTMASSLSIHLLDASMHSCCFHLPAFHAFAPQVDYFRRNIDNLDIASQVVVGILSSLGARASPHSALLGVAGPDIENGKASLDLVLSAGMRRENAWRAIVNRATELCSKPEVLQVPTARNAQTLVAFVQMLMLAESKPRTARFFLRTAMGVFRDMQHSDMSPQEIDAIKAAVGPTLFESDSRIAAYLSMPVLISDADLDEYFEGTGVHVPDLATEDLGPALDEILDPACGPVTRDKLDRALGLTGYFVCAVQRFFSSISAGRRFSNRFLARVPQLWSYVDRAHAAVQHLHRRLVQLDYVPAGCDEEHSVDYDLLIGVRMDERLLDVVHLAHEWLKKQRASNALPPEDRNALEELLATSERRVFVDSLDKHVVYHLVTQLEALPHWATMVAQREGEMTDFGPLSAECALTDTELEWFTKALELACFFTPLAHDRLTELTTARAARQRPAQPGHEQWHFDLSVPTPAATPGQQPDGPPLPLRNDSLAYPCGPSDGTHGDPSLPDRRASSSWQFDTYGTPLGFVDNVSPPSLHATPASTGSGESLDQRQVPPFVPQHQAQHYGNGSLVQPSGQASATPAYASGPALTIPMNGNPGLVGDSSRLSPSVLTSAREEGVTPTSANGRSSGTNGSTPNGDPSWLQGYDYATMLNAETSRTGTTPRGSLASLPLPLRGASIIELPDNLGPLEQAAEAGMPFSQPPPPQHAQAPLPSQAQGAQQGWQTYAAGGGGW
ncbi:hypothetical protein JCM10213v2_004437 [Rhodosporidiobolus nylandii]